MNRPGGTWERGPEEDEAESASLLHVHNLPQLYTRPSASALLHTLDLLSLIPTTFHSTSDVQRPEKTISEEGIPRYLTSIVSSSLAWLPSQADRDSIYEVASARLAERSGRTALPSITRVFTVDEDLKISLHEPSMTEDNLGLKTWTSSLLLAKRLEFLREYLPALVQNQKGSSTRPRVLELGAGTGLVGIAAACRWKADVTLTDLPEIVSNLEQNLQQNLETIKSFGGTARTTALDWSDEAQCPKSDGERFSIILAADPIYSPHHPKILSETVGRWLSRTEGAKFVVELPLRGGYNAEREDLKEKLKEQGLQIEAEGREFGYDDWRGKDGQLVAVECGWTVWRRLH